MSKPFAKLGNALRQLIRMAKGGATRARLDEYLAEQFPPDEDDPKERYRCLRCRDTAFVTIWAPETVAIVLREVKPDIYRECAVACDCPAGDVVAYRKFRSGRKLQRFSDAWWHCPSREPDSKAAIHMLKAKPANRHREFDAFAGNI